MIDFMVMEAVYIKNGHEMEEARKEAEKQAEIKRKQKDFSELDEFRNQ